MRKKSRWLFQTLILSTTLNVALVGIFFYFLIRDNPLQFSFQPRIEDEIENTPLNFSFVSQLKTLSFDHLVELLNDQRMVEQGYRVCDFAAAALATFHDFDVPRALGREKLSRRKWILDEMTFILYPGLSDRDFEKLIYFAQCEKYPFTIKGLLQRMAESEPDTHLLTFFCHTSEFLLLETMFTRTGLPVSKGTLLGMLREGGWQRFLEFYEKQKERADFSDQARRRLLMDYIESGSRTAAYLLLVTDAEFASRQLEDRYVTLILKLLDVKTQEALHFTQQIATSPRSDTVRELAGRRLAELSGEEVVGRYVPRPSEGNLRPLFRELPPAAPAPSTHIIQPGESLWLIARKYNVSIELLMEVNHLRSATIHPGKTLKIPQN